MGLTPGSHLGPYQILTPLGAGGMGEVYRARDARLDRDVAVKVLSERLAENADALARFEREAKAVAALSVGVPIELSRAIQHCLEKNAAARFHSAHDLAFALR